MTHWALLTSSRADIGIYAPLIRLIKDNEAIDLEIIAFGSHLEEQFGRSISTVEALHDKVTPVSTPYEGDKPVDTARQTGRITTDFASIWHERRESLSCVLCLGDRYEMMAAVLAAVPFNIPIAHFHGGETSLGSIDNVYRHCISLMAHTHFVSHRSHYDRLSSLLGQDSVIHEVGSMSLDDLKDYVPMTVEDFKASFEVDLSVPTILFTYHPVTQSNEPISQECDVLEAVLKRLDDYQVLVTLPNMDPGNNEIRLLLQRMAKTSTHIVARESLGKVGYMAAMHHSKVMAGNSSSALIESASFGLHAVDIGPRQQGRTANPNVRHIELDADKIYLTIERLMAEESYRGPNLFLNPKGAAAVALSILVANYA